MDAETHPQTDREYLVCWKVFNEAAEHIPKGQLREMMIAALIKHRRDREERLVKGWAHDHPAQVQS